MMQSKSFETVYAQSLECEICAVVMLLYKVAQ